MSDTEVAEATQMSKKIDGIDEWDVKNAADTLHRAFEIKQNKKLFRAATKQLRKETAAAQKAITWSDSIK